MDIVNMILVLLLCLLFLWFLFSYMVHGFPIYYNGKTQMNGKTVLITGGTRGIGKQTALNLAGRGAKVILGSSNKNIGHKCAAELRELTGNRNVIYKHLDLADLHSVNKFAQEMNTTESRLDVLINNAGISFHKMKKTKQGYERVFGVNYLGHFLLTYLLLDLLKRTAPSRIINVSSIGHTLSMNKPEFKITDPEYWGAKLYPELSGYHFSKLAMIVHVKELSRLLGGNGVTANALHPGITLTPIWTDMRQYCWRIIYYFVMFMTWPSAQSTRAAAQTSIFLASDPGLDTFTGKYFIRGRVSKESAIVGDTDFGQKLWEVSLFLCGISSSIDGKPQLILDPSVNCENDPDTDDEDYDVQSTGPISYRVFKTPSKPTVKPIERV